MAEKKFIITSEQKELLLWNIDHHSLMDAKWIIRRLPEFTKDDQELRLVYEFLKDYPEILENVAKYLLLNLKSEDQKDVKV
jgi:hypothetical protein